MRAICIIVILVAIGCGPQAESGGAKSISSLDVISQHGPAWIVDDQDWHYQDTTFTKNLFCEDCPILYFDPRGLFKQLKCSLVSSNPNESLQIGGTGCAIYEGIWIARGDTIEVRMRLVELPMAILPDSSSEVVLTAKSFWSGARDVFSFDDDTYHSIDLNIIENPKPFLVWPAADSLIKLRDSIMNSDKQ